MMFAFQQESDIFWGILVYIYIMKLVTEENLPRFTPQGFAPFRPRTSVPASLGGCSTT